MSRRFLLACVQLHGSDDLQGNLERCRRWIKEAAERGAELVLLPEDFAFLARGEEEKRKLTQAQLQSIVEAVREEALRHSIYILAGGYPVHAGDDKLYNRA
ncbi:MAG: carbon-nitrogen hydrolase family protein, partial [Myxococcales bacterium]|nr:carbon-nitrogen hydrolase family protein [Myxococcales bacterium]